MRWREIFHLENRAFWSFLGLFWVVLAVFGRFWAFPGLVYNFFALNATPLRCIDMCVTPTFAQSHFLLFAPSLPARRVHNT